MLRSFWNGLLTVFGDIMVFRWPMFLLYKPYGSRIKGEHTACVLDCIRPGDILVRKFDDYLDGRFIPGYFSHVAIYLGEVGEGDRADVERQAARMKGAKGKIFFKAGDRMVIHAVAEGVIVEHLITFCRCDYLAVLRFPDLIERSAGPAVPPLVRDKHYADDELQIQRQLENGESVTFANAWKCIRAAAMGKLGTPYDFTFEFNRVKRMSCCEFVYFATKCLAPFHRIEARNEGIRSLWKPVITPDAFAAAPLELVYASPDIAEDPVRGWRSRREAAGDPCRAPAPTVPEDIAPLHPA